MKKGVSLLVVIVAVTVMLIIISAATVIGTGAITTANYEEYVSELNRVSDNVNEYYIENKELPVTGEVVSATSLGNEFLANMKDKGDLEENLYIVDLSKLKDSTIKKGKGNVSDQDIYLVTQNSQNVYYLKGFKYKAKVYFTS